MFVPFTCVCVYALVCAHGRVYAHPRARARAIEAERGSSFGLISTKMAGLSGRIWFNHGVRTRKCVGYCTALFQHYVYVKCRCRLHEGYLLRTKDEHNSSACGYTLAPHYHRQVPPNGLDANTSIILRIFGLPFVCVLLLVLRVYEFNDLRAEEGRHAVMCSSAFISFAFLSVLNGS